MTLKEAFARAEKLESKIPAEYLKKLTGLSSPKIWHLLNNLCSDAKVYFEVGTYMGSSLMAAVYDNDVKPVAVDNFCMKPKTRNHFFQNVKHMKNLQFIEQDAFTIDAKTLPKIDVYFFDGAHDYDSQYKALTYFIDAMQDEFVLVVDDWNLESAQTATFAAIEKLNLEILEMEERNCPNKSVDDWWCGLSCMRLKKPTKDF